MQWPSIAVSALAVLCAGFPLGAAAQSLPDGPGKELVQGVCTTCHQANMITRSSGYNEAHWKEVIATMIDLSKTPEVQSEIVAYLTKNYPPTFNKRPSKPVAGEHQVRFKEWTGLKLGQRSRDPVEGPDGSIWYVGQYGNLVGRINPTTGEVKEWDLPEKTLPHNVTLDAAGTPWITGNGNGTMVKFDPASGTSTVYKMPDPAARDPHTAIFDKAGILWFTLQQSDMFGRMDPKTADIKVVKAPTKGAKPYGIKIDADGNPWFACNGAPCLVKVDKATMQMREFKLPEGTTVRRIDIAPDGMIWYVNSGLGRIGRLDPKTGQFKEWNSPSGKTSHPYGLIVINGIVWYNESGVRPDMLVRFDPKTEKFQSWPIPSGGISAGIWRHGNAAKNGDLLIHQSSTNRIIRVETTPPPAVR